jgi:hypothetical protein
VTHKDNILWEICFVDFEKCWNWGGFFWGGKGGYGGIAKNMMIK